MATMRSRTSGLVLARQLSDLPAPPFVVFVTAYDEYALRAFEVHAIDYLLKPFGRERFQQTLQHARAHVDADERVRVERERTRARARGTDDDGHERERQREAARGDAAALGGGRGREQQRGGPAGWGGRQRRWGVHWRVRAGRRLTADEASGLWRMRLRVQRERDAAQPPQRAFKAAL